MNIRIDTAGEVLYTNALAITLAADLQADDPDWTYTVIPRGDKMSAIHAFDEGTFVGHF